MPKCVRCGANGLTLRVDSNGLCPACHERARSATAEQFKKLREFYEKYKTIPNAEIEAETILATARSEAAAILAKAQSEATAIVNDANAYAEKVRRDVEDLPRAAEYTSAVVIAELNEKLSKLLKDAASDFHFRAKTTIAAQYTKDRKVDDRELLRDAVATKLLTPSAFRKTAKQKGFIVFDLETTGLSPRRDRIIEIGAIKYENGEEIERFHTLVNPGTHIPNDASKVNHITDDMVVDAPEINDVLPSFLNFVGDLPLVAHNADFDVSFLDNSLRRAKYSAEIVYADSLQMCKKAFPSLPDHKLGTVAIFCGIVIDNQHRAIGDCEALGDIVNSLIK